MPRPQQEVTKATRVRVRGPTLWLRPGQLHQLLLLQRVHHVRQAAFAALRRHQVGERVPGGLVRPGGGGTGPVGARFTAVVVLGGGSRAMLVGGASGVLPWLPTASAGSSHSSASFSVIGRSSSAGRGSGGDGVPFGSPVQAGLS